jgi:hypothetical protein
MAYAAAAGVAGANCMSVLRMLARRAGVIDKTSPQVTREWASQTTGVRPPGGQLGRHLANEALHLGYSAAAGALWGALCRRRQGTVAAATGFGLAVWAVSLLGAAPLLGIARAPWRTGAAANAVNILSHAVYGAVLGLVTEELQRQPIPALTSEPERRAARVG